MAEGEVATRVAADVETPRFGKRPVIAIRGGEASYTSDPRGIG